MSGSFGMAGFWAEWVKWLGKVKVLWAFWSKTKASLLVVGRPQSFIDYLLRKKKFIELHLISSNSTE